MRDTGIADRLRQAGLIVEEQPGWQTRGKSDGFTPRGVMWHHTAAPLGKDAPSLNIVTNGRSDLPGPLCHVLITRSNICIVIAAGKANHAGTGSWLGVADRGNSTMFGIEVENTGYAASEPWRTDQLFVIAKATAALIGNDISTIPKCCMHKEYTRRKIDMHSVSGEDMRILTGEICKQFNNPGPPPVAPPPADFVSLAAAVAQATKQVLKQGSKGDAVKFAQAFLNNKLGTSLAVDGQFGPGTAAAVKQFQTNIRKFFKLSPKEMPADGIIGPSTWYWLTK
jgi:hypothetical protein